MKMATKPIAKPIPRSSTPVGGSYQRYHIDTENTPNILPWPTRFKVKVKRHQLALLLLKEIFRYRGDKDVILSRPCVYGVFSGPLGGFMPREKHCVACLRCTTQYPHIVQIHPNPEQECLGDSYFTGANVQVVIYEAQTGRIPVRGAGYRGRFGGDGFDGMWTDMSEIVRPTRDGIHGREFISTVVDIGGKPPFLSFDETGLPSQSPSPLFSLPLPMVFDLPPKSDNEAAMVEILAEAAKAIGSLAILSLDTILSQQLDGNHIVPLVSPQTLEHLKSLTNPPQMIEMEGWDETAFQVIQARFPSTVLCLRTPFTDLDRLIDWFQAGVRVFHLVADYHGQGPDGRFVHDWIRAVHTTFVEAGFRDLVTLLGSGGIIAAEHVPKAIIAGLDAVALDTPPMVALQAKFNGECRDRSRVNFQLSQEMPLTWGVQRLKNVVAAWRDQLLEILGAMGLREVRRLRGEIGRAMYQKDLEREAFAGIEGYDG